MVQAYEYHVALVNEYMFRRLFDDGNDIELVPNGDTFMQWFVCGHRDAPLMFVRDIVQAHRLWMHYNPDVFEGADRKPLLVNVTTLIWTTGLQQATAAYERVLAATKGFPEGFTPEHIG